MLNIHSVIGLFIATAIIALLIGFSADKVSKLGARYQMYQDFDQEGKKVDCEDLSSIYKYAVLNSHLLHDSNGDTLAEKIMDGYEFKQCQNFVEKGRREICAELYNDTGKRMNSDNPYVKEIPDWYTTACPAISQLIN